jgi:uroporphyrinogen-III synthase
VRMHTLSVTHARRGKLPGALSSGAFDWVAITSPEAALVFLEAWREAGEPKVGGVSASWFLTWIPKFDS